MDLGRYEKVYIMLIIEIWEECFVIIMYRYIVENHDVIICNHYIDKIEIFFQIEKNI